MSNNPTVNPGIVSVALDAGAPFVQPPAEELEATADLLGKLLKVPKGELTEK